MRPVFSVFIVLLFLPAAYPRSRVTVVLEFDRPYSRLSIDEMKIEAQTLLAGSGVDLEWVAASDLPSLAAVPRLVVLRLRGSCDVSQHLPAQTLDPAPLGYTYLSAGEPLPFSDVECDRIRGLMSSAATSRTFGRALGRVIAHEFHHVLDRTCAHTRSSYNRESLSRADLVSSLAPRN